MSFLIGVCESSGDGQQPAMSKSKGIGFLLSAVALHKRGRTSFDGKQRAQQHVAHRRSQKTHTQERAIRKTDETFRL